jgi:GrpB-like predicted nucleotidyltransferase (UPF0157 family)
VPGLLAKDVIDVQVTVDAFDGLGEILAACGFALRPEIVFDHRAAGSAVPDEQLAKRFAQTAAPRRVNLHVRLPGRYTSAIRCSVATTCAATRRRRVRTARSNAT